MNAPAAVTSHHFVDLPDILHDEVQQQHCVLLQPFSLLQDLTATMPT